MATLTSIARVKPRWFAHRRCTYILDGRPSLSVASDPRYPRFLRERTHGCWCSSWKLIDDGTWRVWRRGRWVRPKHREVYSPKRGPNE